MENSYHKLTENRTYLCLYIITSESVSHCSERRGNNLLVWMHEQLDQPPAEPCIHNTLDLVVGTISEVGNGPTTVGEYLSVIRMKELCQYW